MEPNVRNYIRVEGKNAFHRGDVFDNFEQVANRLQEHTRESFVYYWIRDSRLVRFAHTKVSRKIDENLLYYSVKFSCIYGGQRFKSKANGLRQYKRQTRQIDCPAFISLRATKCGRKLEVIDVCNDHTHEISEEAIEELPQKRRPSQALLEEIYELLYLDIDKKLIIEYVKQKENKNILKKDLFNMTKNLRLDLSKGRSDEKQKAILHRITTSGTADVIEEAILKKLQELEPNRSLNSCIEEDISSPHCTTLDVFESSTSVMDFPSLSSEMNLLNSTVEVKNHMEYDELLCNRIVVDYEEERSLNIKPEDLAQNHVEENNWNEVASSSSIIYEDLICGNDSNYPYDELNLDKEIPKQIDATSSPSTSPISNHSQDFVNDLVDDLILISPEEAVCSNALSLNTPEEVNPEEYNKLEIINSASEVNKCLIETHLEEQKQKCTNQTKLSKRLALKTLRNITRCRNCGTNARLVKMQISYLKQKKVKLLQQTEVLRLKKQKLKAEIEAIKQGFVVLT